MKTYKKIAAGMALLGLLAVTTPVLAAPFDWNVNIRNVSNTADVNYTIPKAATSTHAFLSGSSIEPHGPPSWTYVSSQFGIGNPPLNGRLEDRTLTIEALEYDKVTGLPDMLDAKANITTVTALQDQVNGLSIPANPSIATTSLRSLATTTGATGWQVSPSRNSEVRYSSTIVTTANIAGNSSGTVVLEIAPVNATTSPGWTEVGRCSNGQALSLAIALQSVQTTACQLSAWVPAGYYAKLRSVVVAGSPVFTVNSQQEVLH